MNVTRHDSYLAFSRADDAGTIWSNESRRFVPEILLHLDHIQGGNTLGNANNNREAGVGCFHDRVGGKRRRHVDHRRIRACFLDCIRDGIEYRNAFVISATFPGVTPPTTFVPYSSICLV